MRVITSVYLLLMLWHGFNDGDHRYFPFGDGSEALAAISMLCESGGFLPTSKQVYTISHDPETMTMSMISQNTLGTIRMRDASTRDLVS
jgi:hypothetical protein